jgi:hypothetical protein
MIEKVARALCYYDDEDPDEIIQGRPRWRFSMAAAHGAIAAMREPTTNQLQTYCDPRNEAMQQAVADEWRGMIDAALSGDT